MLDPEAKASGFHRFSKVAQQQDQLEPGAKSLGEILSFRCPL